MRGLLLVVPISSVAPLSGGSRHYGTASSFAHAFHAFQLSRKCALASCRVATLFARVIGALTGRRGLATKVPLSTVDGIVRAVLVDPGAKTGRAELEGH